MRTINHIYQTLLNKLIPITQQRATIGDTQEQSSDSKHPQKK
jgi:hypothetical protein